MNYDEATRHIAAMAADTHSVSRLLTAGLTPEVFLEPVPGASVPRLIWAFVRDHFDTDGTAPPRRVLEAEFEQYYKNSEIPTESDLQPEYLVAWIQGQAVRARVQEVVRDAYNRILNPDNDAVEELSRFREGLEGLHKTVSPSSSFEELLMSPGDYGEEEGTDTHIVPNLVVPGCITCIAALFKTGKTEFVSSMLHRIEHGQDFMNHPVRQSRVLYLSAPVRSAPRSRGMSSVPGSGCCTSTKSRSDGTRWSLRPRSGRSRTISP
jgi:hypothetical protein